MRWVKSSRCEANNCVEVARQGDTMHIRDSKDPRPVLTFTIKAWREFTHAILGR